MKKLFILLLIPLFFISCGSKSEEIHEPEVVTDINGHSVAVLLGSVQDMIVSNETENCEILRMASLPEVIAAVSHGKAEYALIDEASLLGFNMDASGLKSVKFSGYDTDIAVAFNNVNGAVLQLDFDTYIKQIKEDGTLKEMFDRWTGPNMDNVQMPTFEMNSTEKPIEIGILFSDPPFSYIKDNELVGFEVEMTYRWAAANGHCVHFNNLEFASMIAALQTGKIDMIVSCMAITEERKEKVLFSEPYYNCGVACVFPSGKEVSDVPMDEKMKQAFEDNMVEEGRWKMILWGLWETVVISFWSLIFGTILGSGICYLGMRKNRFAQGFAKVYVDFMRGIPILVFLMILFYVVFSSAGLSARGVAVIAFSLNFAAFAGEMFRSGIEGVDKGQYEAAWAMGFSKIKTFFWVILPQSLRQIIPVYKGEAVSLIKNTSIVGYIAIQDLTKVSDIIRSRTFDAFFPLLIITVMYFLLAWLLGLLLDRINVK